MLFAVGAVSGQRLSRLVAPGQVRGPSSSQLPLPALQANVFTWSLQSNKRSGRRWSITACWTGNAACWQRPAQHSRSCRRCAASTQCCRQAAYHQQHGGSRKQLLQSCSSSSSGARCPAYIPLQACCCSNISCCTHTRKLWAEGDIWTLHCMRAHPGDRPSSVTLSLRTAAGHLFLSCSSGQVCRLYIKLGS